MTRLAQHPDLAPLRDLLPLHLLQSGLAQHLTPQDHDLPQHAELTLLTQDRDELARRVKDLLAKAHKARDEAEQAALTAEIARLQPDLDRLNQRLLDLQRQRDDARRHTRDTRALLTLQQLHDHAAQHLATQPLAALYAAWAALTALRQLQDDLAPDSSLAPLLSLRSPLLDLASRALQTPHLHDAWTRAAEPLLDLQRRDEADDALLLDAQRRVDALAVPTRDAWDARLTLLPDAQTALQNAALHLHDTRHLADDLLASPHDLDLLLLPAHPERAARIAPELDTPLRAWASDLQHAPAALQAHLDAIPQRLLTRQKRHEHLNLKLQNTVFLLETGQNIARLASILPALRDQHDLLRDQLNNLPHLDPREARPQALDKLERLLTLHAWADAAQEPLLHLASRVEHADTRAARKRLAALAADLAFDALTPHPEIIEHTLQLADLYKKLTAVAAAQLQGLLNAIDPALEDDSAWDPAWAQARQRLPAEDLTALLNTLDAENEKLTSRVLGFFKSKDRQNLQLRKARFERVLDAAARREAPIRPLLDTIAAITLPGAPTPSAP